MRTSWRRTRRPWRLSAAEAAQAATEAAAAATANAAAASTAAAPAPAAPGTPSRCGRLLTAWRLADALALKGCLHLRPDLGPHPGWNLDFERPRIKRRDAIRRGMLMVVFGLPPLVLSLLSLLCVLILYYVPLPLGFAVCAVLLRRDKLPAEAPTTLRGLAKALLWPTSTAWEVPRKWRAGAAVGLADDSSKEMGGAAALV